VASFDFAPDADAAENKAGEQEQNYENSGDRKPSGGEGMRSSGLGAAIAPSHAPSHIQQANFLH